MSKSNPRRGRQQGKRTQRLPPLALKPLSKLRNPTVQSKVKRSEPITPRCGDQQGERQGFLEFSKLCKNNKYL